MKSYLKKVQMFVDGIIVIDGKKEILMIMKMMRRLD
jgi:hypothetical protein